MQVPGSAAAPISVYMAGPPRARRADSSSPVPYTHIALFLIPALKATAPTPTLTGLVLFWFGFFYILLVSARSWGLGRNPWPGLAQQRAGGSPLWMGGGQSWFRRWWWWWQSWRTQRAEWTLSTGGTSVLIVFCQRREDFLVHEDKPAAVGPWAAGGWECRSSWLRRLGQASALF